MDWGWGQGIKSHHTQTCQGIWLYSCRLRRLTWAKEKNNWTVAQWSKVLFSDESKFCISFGNQGPSMHPVYQDILEHFVLSSADQLFKDADFIFQKDLSPAHTAKSTKSWLNDHGVGVLDWPANSPDLNPIENLWGIVKRKIRNETKKWKATVKETWASIPPQQCHKLITSMPRRIESVIKAKGAPTKYWVHIQLINILSRRSTIH